MDSSNAVDYGRCLLSFDAIVLRMTRYVVARNEVGDIVKVIECESEFDVSTWTAHLERRAKKWGTGVTIKVERRKPEK